MAETLPWRVLRFAKSRLRLARFLQVWRQPRPSPVPILLAINHYFDNESKALGRLQGFPEHFDLCLVSPEDLFNANLLHFPPDVWWARVPYEDASLARNRVASRRHAARVWDRLLAVRPIAAVVTPSDAFYWLREFIREGQARGIPTFVFDKEGTITPASFATHAEKVRHEFPPISDRVYVWSERQRDFYARCGYDVSKVRVLGSLRTDLYVNMPPAHTRGVLFFDFDDDAYLNTVEPERVAGRDWSQARRSLHQLLADTAARHPDVRVTLKCHPQQRDIAAMRVWVADQGLPNLCVAWTAQDVDELVQAHSIILGFQSTALLETALTDRPTIYCAWGAMHDELASLLIPLMEPGFGVHRARSLTEVRRMVENHVAGRSIGPAPNRDRLSMFFHQADGHVAQRYVDALKADLGSQPL